jgi:hypothetical protein
MEEEEKIKVEIPISVIVQLEKQKIIKPLKERNQRRYYFELHLKEMHLTENQVCRLCKRHTVILQKLKTVDYPLMLYQMFEESFKKANIDIANVREFFVLQNLQQTVPACLRCKAYKGQKPPSDFAWNILNSNGSFAAELIEPQISFRLEKLGANKK